MFDTSLRFNAFQSEHNHDITHTLQIFMKAQAHVHYLVITKQSTQIKQIVKITYCDAQTIGLLVKDIMRSYKTARQLSYSGFIETFGKVPVDEKTDDCKISSKRRSIFGGTKEMTSSLLKAQGSKFSNITQEITHNSTATNNNNNNLAANDEKTNQTPVHKETRVDRMSRKFRRISLLRRDNKSSTSDGKKLPSLHRSKSVSFLAKSSKSLNRLSSLVPSHNKNGRTSPVTDVTGTPISKKSCTAHSGFLSKKNEKKETWTRYWCILQDSCIYCYSSPDTDFADDVIALGGYCVKNKYTGPKSLSSILLERAGKESYELKADSLRSQNSWVDALRNGMVGVKRPSVKLQRSTSYIHSSESRTSVLRSDRTLEANNQTPKCVSVAKINLLEEILAQQREIIHEQKMLQKLTISKDNLASLPHQKHPKTASTSSLAQSEDHGYCSSLDGSMHESSEYTDSRHHSPNARSFRSMSNASVASSLSLCSIAEDARLRTAVCPRVMAEIEDFQKFSKQTMERRRET